MVEIVIVLVWFTISSSFVFVAESLDILLSGAAGQQTSCWLKGRISAARRLGTKTLK
jgi:hypothetical protein